MNTTKPKLTKKIKIIPRTKIFRPVNSNDTKYAPPRLVPYRSPSPYAHIANFK